MGPRQVSLGFIPSFLIPFSRTNSELDKPIIDHRLRESKLSLEHEHKMLRDEVAVMKMKTKAFALERARSMAQIKERKAELAKREELAIANDHKVAELERKIARMKGTMSPENRRVCYLEDRVHPSWQLN